MSDQKKGDKISRSELIEKLKDWIVENAEKQGMVKGVAEAIKIVKEMEGAEC